MARRFDPALDQPPPGWLGGAAPEPGAAHGLAELSEAVRAHEWVARGRSVPQRPVDHELYRRLEEIERSSDERSNGGLG